jgi:NAD(P)-dependent dehydrogenase (short-subunit alcohol dehydrogenase family)
MVDNVVQEFGRIDVLVNNAGILKRTPFLDITDDEWDAVLNTNLRGYFVCGQTVARHMRDAKIAGTIIKITSVRAVQADARVAHYSVTKAAIVMLTKQMALELAPYGIRVNAIAPGLIETDLNRMDIADPGFRGQIPDAHSSPSGRPFRGCRGGRGLSRF